MTNFSFGERVSVFLFLFLFFAFPAAAHAFSVSPLKFTTTLDPGTSKNFEIAVGNDETEIRTYRITMQSLNATEQGQIFFEKGKSPAENWVTAFPNSFSLKPGETKLVDIKISIPSSQSPGSYSLAIVARSENGKDQTVGIAGQSAVPLLLTVAGEVNEKLTISEWKEMSKIFTRNEFGFSLLLSNEGNVNLNGVAELRVKNFFNRQKYSEKVNLGSEIFANSKRKIKIESSSSLWPGIYKAEIIVQYGLLGTNLKAVTSFLFLPLWFTIGIAFIMTAVMFWFLRRGSRTKYEEREV